MVLFPLIYSQIMESLELWNREDIGLNNSVNWKPPLFCPVRLEDFGTEGRFARSGRGFGKGLTGSQWSGSE